MEICLNYHIEILEQSQKQEIQKNNEEGENPMEHVIQALKLERRRVRVLQESNLLLAFVAIVQMILLALSWNG